MGGKRNILRTILMLIFLAIIGVSAWKLYEIYAEYKVGTDQYDNLANEFLVSAGGEDSVGESAGGGTSADGTDEGNGDEGEKVKWKPFDWSTLTNKAPISVSFDELKKKCDDVVGWLYCEGTPINYPVVQSEDNDYYLYRLIDGTSNKSGSIFMDFRNQADLSDRNTILYGHNMKNDSMFGVLADYQEQGFYDAHPIMYFLTPDQDYRIELVSGYVVPSDDAMTYSVAKTEEERDAMLSAVLKKSTFQTKATIEGGENLITLSTCVYDYDNARYVLIGILKPLEK